MVATRGVRDSAPIPKLAPRAMDPLAAPPPPARPAPTPLSFFFGLREPVDRRTYALVGFGLMLAKYAIDAGIIYAFVQVVWTPLDYMSPLLTTRDRTLGQGHGVLQAVMLAWTLPFMWIGLVMTIRRTYDAGMSAWAGLMYFVPFANYGWMLLLCTLPTMRERALPGGAPPPPRRELGWSTRRAFGAVSIGLLAIGALSALSIYALGQYGLVLFLGAPVLLGAITAFAYNFDADRPRSEALLVGLLALGVAYGALMLIALEGVICLAMAAPLALPMVLAGALVGREIARMGNQGLAALWIVPLCSGGFATIEAALAAPAHFEVVLSIDVAAPPEVVWRHVVSFSELPEPDWPLFKVGLAYPVRARIEGRGVGAVRRCEFSTGAFVEPITAWDEPRRLAFDVAEQPPAMHEWSPYRRVHPPHLDGYFASERGEFRLVALENGGTRLEGSTWYALRFGPASYWRVWSDFFLHRIHGRVLEHVKRLAEDEARAR